MPEPLLTVADLAPFVPNLDTAKAEALVGDALALAGVVAPCITGASFTRPDAARAILRGAVLRWLESGQGAVTQQTAGPFGMTVDNRQDRKTMFWPTEIEMLQSLCRSAADTSDAFTITPVGAPGWVDPWRPLWTSPMG